MEVEQYSRWFYTQLRVRYQETDQMGVVYHANYLNWFEIGRTELIRELGIEYIDIEKRGLLLPVTELTTKFRMPARYDDQVTVCTRIAAFSSRKLHFQSEVRLFTDDPEGKLLVSGETHHVWVNREFRPVRMDKEAPELYACLEQAVERKISE